MLDDVLDTESGLKSRSNAQCGGVGGSIRHLAQDVLEAYVNARLTSAKLDYCRTHLDACEACRAELEDLRTFRSTSTGLPGSEPVGRKLERRKRRRRLESSLVAAGATICVAAIAAVLWWGHEKSRASQASVAAIDTHSATAAPKGTMKPVATLANATADMQSRGTTPTSIQPSATILLRGRAPMPPAAPPVNTRFALLGPFGEAVSETRPEFIWQPLAGAAHYSVVIVDEGLHPVQRSHALRTTVWRPRRPLRRGHTYLWQVTATLRGGTKVVASAPSEARLRIAPATAKLADNEAP
ncbi:MAG: hypothetical protein JWO52_2073 [Gammaproteobacteria bacterium]|nr:hypothetical protein [Gammaproteobacteria bacterium]